MTVQTWMDQAFFYNSVRDLYNRIFGALGLIIGVIVVFVVTNAMAMAIIERTREIGTLRALGTLPASCCARWRWRAWCWVVWAPSPVRLSLAVSLMLYVFPVNMPPPPGARAAIRCYLHRRDDLPRHAAGDGAVSMLASAWIARKTVHVPVVDALAHT